MKSYEVITEDFSAHEPSLSCGLAGGFLGVMGFQNSSHLVHGSSGCGFAMRYGLSQHWKAFIPCPVTSIDEKNVIFGGSHLLKEGINKVEQIYSSDVLFILTACSSEVIGDDIEEVALIESEKRKKIIVPVEVGGATGNIFDGYNFFLYKTMEFLHKKFMEEEQVDSKKPEIPQIDILGIIPFYDMFFRGDMTELNRLFQRLGVQVNSFFSGECSIDSMKRSLNSDLTVSISRNIGERALRSIKRNIGAKTKSFMVAPIGFEYTKKFLKSVASDLNIDPDHVEKILEDEDNEGRKKMLRGFDFSKVMFTAGKFAVIGEPSRTLGLTNFLLNEVGMKSVIIAFTTKANEEELDELDKILKVRNNHSVVLNDEDSYLIRKCLLDMKPNLVFGRSIDRVKELENTIHITWQFPSTNRLVVYDKPYLGFNGIVSIIDDIINGFSNKWY